MAPTADPSRLEAATRRLSAALSGLETAIARRIENERGQERLQLQAQAAEEDRARLAEELDRSTDRIALLEAANRDVVRRLDQSMDAIRGVLAAYES
ncbi:DUF4164 family protein [Phreatobacter aquaticus]|uniref:DUF4164 family protein n=1 Tax=Phreatobacter aquaticus TaxID=2570229 RepID=A0A4D7QID2_9HYPH|nr:DUF4164 family protein [Phreatobacter aquaticus]QCK86745.1 DUF4164 family protein [Phreatobacter aquaticus]